jgi:hypothetical protein
MGTKVMVTGGLRSGALELGDHIGYLSRSKGVRVASVPVQLPGGDSEQLSCCLVLGEAASPAAEELDYLISLDGLPKKGIALLKKGGILVVNGPAAATEEMGDIELVTVPAAAIAEELVRGRSCQSGAKALVGSVMFGVYLGLSLQEAEYTLILEMYNHFPPGVAVPPELRLQAVHRGYEFARSSEPVIEYGR